MSIRGFASSSSDASSSLETSLSTSSFMKRITGDICKFSLSVPAASAMAVVITVGSNGDDPHRHAKKREIRKRFMKCVACAPTGPGVSQANMSAAAY